MNVEVPGFGEDGEDRAVGHGGVGEPREFFQNPAFAPVLQSASPVAALKHFKHETPVCAREMILSPASAGTDDGKPLKPLAGTLNGGVPQV